MAGMRLQDDPLIKEIHDKVDRILNKQEEFEKRLLDPEKGIYARITDLERWKQNQEKEYSFKRQLRWRIIVAVITTLLATGGLFGYVIRFFPK